MIGFLYMLGAVLLVAAAIGAFYDWLYPEERGSGYDEWASMLMRLRRWVHLAWVRLTGGAA